MKAHIKADVTTEPTAQEDVQFILRYIERRGGAVTEEEVAKALGLDTEVDLNPFFLLRDMEAVRER
ncbi:MAG: hypothetical protein JRN62_10155 [Nitrososphaerota archaeon]|jgi:hypothetical protein|nr:hypothetical protein [Nitrososphaerota archaeon]MDG6949827.1 hypothetical protein [Nitrososphaerota archaeon]